jgi:hypothetical protein
MGCRSGGVSVGTEKRAEDSFIDSRLYAFPLLPPPSRPYVGFGRRTAAIAYGAFDSSITPPSLARGGFWGVGGASNNSLKF